MRYALLLALLGSASFIAATAQLVLPGVPMGAMKLPPAQVAFGKPQTPQCEPWGAVWPNVDSVTAEVPAFQLTLLADVVPAERRLETPVQFGFVHLMHSSWWDALAPYNTTAKPILAAAAIPRQPASARTNANMNTAVAYALLRLCEAYLPDAVPGLLAKFRRWKLDPMNKAQGTNSPAGIGNKVAAAWIKYGEQDGFNRLGDKVHGVHRRPYADYIGFIGDRGPNRNDAYTLRDISAWQPLLETNGLGYFFTQHAITPFIGLAKPFSMDAKFMQTNTLPSPYPDGPTSPKTRAILKAETDRVIDISAKLTDKQKIEAEHYDDKLVSLAPISYFLATLQGWDPHTMAGATLAMNCVYDATLLSWKEKIRHNAVRPVSTVRYFYNNTKIRGYAGPANGVTEHLGDEWSSYLRTMPHAEYPSGTSCVCAAFGEFMKRFLKSNSFPIQVDITWKKGCSRRDTGRVPAKDLTLSMSNIDAMIEECGMSRQYAGVHFRDSITAGRKLCGPVGEVCFKKYQSLIK